ncbi:hypothetical protein TWF506_005805 [Arthrobotrys conoides]|uniref:Uncharacterized protein n=1 Tax=Arthrobotrys conoides TaxID=74498 RepID=A0AAN8RQ40_9PEZI
MRMYNKPMMWQAGALAALLFLKGIEAGVAAVTEESLGGYIKLVKRINDDGIPEVHMDLHERWHKDEIGQALRKRETALEEMENAYALLPRPTKEEQDMFTTSFGYDCGNSAKISSIEELTGAAMTIMSKSGHYEIDGWSTPGTISLGNQATDPKKYQGEIPVHCLGEAGKTAIVMSPVKPNAEFKYGISLSRALIGRCINTLIYVCSFDLKGVSNFQFSPKQARLNFVQVRTVAKSCEDWVNPLCKSTDDESKAECLAEKLLLGIPWSKTLPTPTKPGKKRK